MSHCSQKMCSQINCSGCKDGKVWCEDPSCAPYCRGCRPPKGHEQGINMVFASILVILLTIVAVLIIFYGPRWAIYHDGDPNNPYEINPGYGWDYPID